MQGSMLWSLRLGFSGKQSTRIQELGLEGFLENSFISGIDKNEPECLKDEPKSISELRSFRTKMRSMTPEETKMLTRQRRRATVGLKRWWISQMRNEPYPLREKMVCFWHNHFVATSQKVKVNYWIYRLNMTFRENAFGNFRDLTKRAVKSNAMVRYLDNTDNRKGQLNENLSRELLELFTLGIGHYTEDDIKNGAKALAGLGIGEREARYRKPFEVNEPISYLGKSGRFKVDDLIDIIFDQEAIPYLITRKILQWFIYDKPEEDLVKYYGDFFRKVDFEIKPLLIKIFSEEYTKDNAGSKIKDPLVYILQLINELNITEIDDAFIAFFIQQQGMDLFNQPNVKGWQGGTSWLTSQIYLQRNKVSDLLCSGRSINRKIFENRSKGNKVSFEKINIKLNWDHSLRSDQIIQQLSERLLFGLEAEQRDIMQDLLKSDFDPNSPNAERAILRLFNHMTKIPEYQLI